MPADGGYAQFLETPQRASTGISSSARSAEVSCHFRIAFILASKTLCFLLSGNVGVPFIGRAGDAWSWVYVTV